VRLFSRVGRQAALRVELSPKPALDFLKVRKRTDWLSKFEAKGSTATTQTKDLIYKYKIEYGSGDYISK
jgi:hypothetical protein